MRECFKSLRVLKASEKQVRREELMGPKGLKAHMQSKTHPGILPERHRAEGSHAPRKSVLFESVAAARAESSLTGMERGQGSHKKGTG